MTTDTSGNSSRFTGDATDAVYTVETDIEGQTRIKVSGEGAEVTLENVKTGLAYPYATLLQDLGNGVWQLNANLFIDTGVTLYLGTESGSSELRLRSEAVVQAAGATALRAVTEPDGRQADAAH